ncbi:sortase [Streptomyces sp. NPDC005283]|uniref:sortase n=1 Tax=Streptomyces sp. NPDC005283 TaxID=3156871 RepID=UPI0034513786
MRNTRVGVSIGLVIAALGLSASAAVAAGDPDLDIGPGDASPGSTVTVRTTACGPDVTYGKGESEAGGAFHLFKGERAGVLTGEFQVPEDTEPGSDTVTVKCPPRTKVTDTYQVAGHQPSGAVDAGFGPAGDRGTQFALLGVLLAGAAAGGVVRRRRRLSGNRT